MTDEANMGDVEVEQVVEASLRAVDSILWAAEAGSRQIDQARSGSAPSANGSDDDSDARLSLALRELALGSFANIRAECDSLAAASKRAMSMSEGRTVHSTQSLRSREVVLPRGEAPPATLSGGRSAPLAPGAPAADAGGIRPLLRAISSRRRIVVAAVLAALLGAVAYLALGPSTYEATSNVLVQPVPQDDPTYLSLGVIRDSGDAIRTTQTAATLLDTTEAADRTAQELGEGWTPQLVEDSINVAPIGETSIIAITGTASDADESAQLANAFVDASLTMRDRQLEQQVDQAISRTTAELDELDPADPNAIELSNQLNQLDSIKQSGDPSLDLQQVATVPDSPSNPGAMIIIPLALIAGLVLGSGGALLMELLDRRIIDAEEAAEIYPISVLTRVPLLPAKSLEAPEGTAWYMPPEIREAFLTVAVQLEQRDHPPASLLVTSPTRGDGKTTSAINLAVTLATTGRSVILLDFDLRNPRVGSSLGMAATATPAQLIESDSNLEEFLAETDLPSLRVLPVRVDHEGSPGDADATQLRGLIRQARGLADCVVIDTPPLGEVSDALALLREIDDILVVLRPGNTNRSHLRDLADLLERTGHRPEGSILIDSSERATGGYFSSGYGVRRMPDLVVGGNDSSPSTVESPPVEESAQTHS